MRSFRRETGLYLLALLFGLAVRLIGLGSQPLSDQEARWALQAYDIVNGTRSALGSQPAYAALTSALFFAFGGTTNTLARLIPALVGSGLVLVPALFRERLKPRAAVILAFAIALEPGLTALSRQAGSSILALSFTMAAWGLWEQRKPAWAGIFAGLALLSGSALWAGLLGLTITWGLLRPFEREKKGQVKPSSTGDRGARRDWLTLGGYAVGGIVLLGTMFMTIPGGLSAWVAGLPEYVMGWTRLSDIPVMLLPLSLVVYQPVAVLLALIAIVRGWAHRSLRVQRLSLWMVVALLLAVFYPSREVVDLAWALIPLWALASLEVARALNVPHEDRREVLGASALSFIILAFIWLNYLAMRRPTIPPDQAQLRSWLLVGSFFLLIISLLLVGVGWSIRVARFGALWGVVGFFALYSFSVLMAAAGLRSGQDNTEMWRPGAQLPMADLLLQTVRDQSAWSDEDQNAQPAVIAGIDSPALRWLLRDRPLELRASAGAASNPPMVITPDEQDPTLAAGYRGQSFVWRYRPAWALFHLSDWLPFHEAPREAETVILWVRNDLFPDAKPRSLP